MRVFYGFEGTSQITKAVCTVGSYDGVHVGHQRLIAECRAVAQQIGGQSVVLTFFPHPRIVLGRAEGLKLLTTLPEKIKILESEGVDNLIVIPFDEPFSRVQYRDFVEQYLLDKVGMECMVVGYNHLFGHKNEGNYSLLRELSDERGFRVVELEEQRSDSQKVSSTVIRRLVESGDVEQATKYLGRPYLILDGKNEWKLLPPEGRYLARVEGEVMEVDITAEGTKYREIEILKKI